MNKLVLGLLFSLSFLSTTWVLAQDSGSGVLVSPPVQNQGSSQDNSGNNGNNGGNITLNSTDQGNSNSTGKSKHIQANSDIPSPQNSNNDATTKPNKPSGTAAKGKHRVPSQESINACQDKAEGDTCQVTGSHGTREGICAYTSDKKYLFCRRNHKRTHTHTGQQNT